MVEQGEKRREKNWKNCARGKSWKTNSKPKKERRKESDCGGAMRRATKMSLSASAISMTLAARLIQIVSAIALFEAGKIR